MRVEQREFHHKYNSGHVYRYPPNERKTLVEVSSIDDMDAVMDKPSYYFDGEWLHVKQVGEYDRIDDSCEFLV